jgi:hypothetical protein
MDRVVVRRSRLWTVLIASAAMIVNGVTIHYVKTFAEASSMTSSL